MDIINLYFCMKPYYIENNIGTTLHGGTTINYKTGYKQRINTQGLLAILYRKSFNSTISDTF